MSQNRSLAAAKGIIGIAILALLLGGCVYDYAQHTDRVGYSAGNAVKANLARETTNPSTAWGNVTTGLGKNGPVIPAPAP